MPIQIDWGNLKNYDFEILFPYPTGSLDNGILTIGYENIVNFPVRIKFQNDQEKIKQVITLNYLVCKEICIPISEKKININKQNIIKSDEFENAYNKVPKQSLNEYEIHSIKSLGSNKIRASLRSDKKLQIESIFAYSEESVLTVNIFDNSKNIIEIFSDIPFDSLTKPIQIAFDNGFTFNEIQL